jgi:two-component system, LytTR family, sensor kinase
METRRPNRNALAGLAGLAWKQPLYAAPFALFFGLMYGHGARGFLLAYEISLAFAYLIGLGVWTAMHVVVPRLNLPAYDSGAGAVWLEAAVYASLVMAGAYAGALVAHLWIMPGFLGGPRAIAITGMYTLIFCGLFSALSYARVFYRRSLERGRAVETMRAELAQAELRALRAQVNPHFLFNTLNSIAALIPVNPAAAEETTTQLAEVFRYALRASDHERSRLADELAFIRSYLEIEQVRLGSRLQVHLDVAAGLESIPVPSLLLQPLVENAVLHGVAPRPEGGAVRLTATRDGALLVIDVQDDGPGMPAGRADGGNGFGLRSVEDRLRALGPPHTILIDSAPGRGTRVRVTLPCEPSNPSRPPVADKERCHES